MQNLFRRQLIRLSIPTALHRPAGQSGQSLVEFALLFPLLLLILLGAIDLGRAFNAYVTITNASREGARYGSTHPTNTSGVTTRVQAELSGVVVTGITQECAPPPPSTLFSACNSTTAVIGNQIRVTVNTSFEFLTLYLFRLPNIPMSNFTIMAIAQTN
jgi:Flp pilus assembly protein TadG